MAAELARLTVEQLEGRLKREAPLRPGMARTSGHIVVVRQGRQVLDEAGRPSNRMKVVVRGLTVRDGRTDPPSRELHLEVRGQGSEEGMLRQTASALARQILKPPRPQEGVAKKQGPGRGFD